MPGPDLTKTDVTGTHGPTRRDFMVGASVAGAVLLAGSDAVEAANPVVESQSKVPITPRVASFAAHKHDPRPTCVAATPDEKAVTCDDGGKVYLWTLEPTISSTAFKKLRAVKASCVAVSKTGNRVLCGGFDGLVSVSDLANQKRLGLFDDHDAAYPDAEVWSVAVNSNGTSALSGTNGGEIRFWDVAGTHTTASYLREEESVNALAFLPGGTHFLSGHGDGVMILWEIAADQLTPLTKFTDGTPQPINSIAVFARGSETWAVAGYFDTVIRFWKMPDLGNAPATVDTADKRVSGKHKHFVWRVAVSPGGDRFASAGQDRAVQFFDIDGNQLHPPVTGVENGVMGIDFVSQTRVVYTTGVAGDGTNMDSEVAFIDIP